MVKRIPMLESFSASCCFCLFSRSIVKRSVANLLFMSRFVNCFLLICSQRLFAEQLIFGSRDSITNTVILGDPSSESLRAFCTSDEIKQMRPRQQGGGYLIREGKKPLEITVSAITRPDKLEAAILRAVTKNEKEREGIDTTIGS
jgi:hypothetical protein